MEGPLNNKYIKNLDGLRAYSVIGVLLYHAGISVHFYYGWIGVQVFFIISGYLITTILLDSKKSNNYFKIFYTRRILRIFPIYYLVLIFTVIFAFIINSSIKDIWFYLFYIQNYKLSWVNWNPQFPKLLNHTWSLAIEEQFYLFWPLMVWLLSKRKLIILCFLLILTAFLVKYLLSLKFPGSSINWANTLANFDMLASGALLAVVLKNVAVKKVLNGCLCFSVLTLLIYLSVFYFKAPHQLFWVKDVKLTEVDGQAFLILVIPFIVLTITYLIYKNNIFTKIFFSNSIIVYVGKISYGIYLYHFIVFLILDQYSHINNIFILSTFKFFLTMLISILSWHFIEKKFLDFKKYFIYR